MSTTPEKQRRLQNLLSAGNLAANYTSAKRLKEISDMIKLKLEEEKKQTKLKEKLTREEILAKRKLTRQQEEINRRKLAQIQKEEEEEKQKKILREIFFNLTEELNDLKKSKKSTLEKYFCLLSINSNLKSYKISTSMTEDYKEKKIIKDFINNLNDEIKKTKGKFTKDDEKDLKTIIDILETDEETKINKIKESNKFKKFIQYEDERNIIKESTDIFSLIGKYSKNLKNL
jgi:hypothetical protein